MWSAFILGLSIKLNLHSKLDGNRNYPLKPAHRFSFIFKHFSKTMYIRTNQFIGKVLPALLNDLFVAWQGGRVFSYFVPHISL